MYIPRDNLHDPLYVVTCISNSWRYHRRWELYRNFAKHVSDLGGKLVTVEAAYGERDHAVTSAEATRWGDYKPHPGELEHIQLRTRHELWHKENMLNIGISRLPHDWKYVAWIDADVTFSRPDVFEETLHQLQRYAVVQMWDEAFDLGPGHRTIPGIRAKSFAACYLSSLTPDPKGRYGYWHSGYAWAIRRDAFDKLYNGLLDYAPLGSADFYMAWALIGKLDEHLYQSVKDISRRDVGFSEGYITELLRWQRHALDLRKNLGCVGGTLLHQWHGKKRERFYNTRENILIDNEFDPRTDLHRDSQGLLQLYDTGTERSIALRNQMRCYFAVRNEDSIDLDEKDQGW